MCPLSCVEIDFFNYTLLSSAGFKDLGDRPAIPVANVPSITTYKSHELQLHPPYPETLTSPYGQILLICRAESGKQFEYSSDVPSGESEVVVLLNFSLGEINDVKTCIESPTGLT